MARYDRQERLWGQEGQAKLADSTIAIIGEDPFAFPAALNAALVGVNARLFISGIGVEGSYALDFTLKGRNLSAEYTDVLQKINPFVRVSGLPVTFESREDNHFLDGVEAIVDATNNPVSKKVGLEFALQRRIQFISMQSIEGYSVIETGNHTDGQFKGAPKDCCLAWPAGALAIEKAIRFMVYKQIEDEPLFLNPGYTFPFDHTSDAKLPDKNQLSGKTVMVVGVGGQGCFAVPILVESNPARVIYVDHDSVKDHNLSRQPFYWDSVGRYKAEVCAEKHNKMVGGEIAVPLVRKFDEHFDYPEQIDVIYGFTDSMFSRMLISHYCSRKGITFIAAGSDPGGAEFCSYVPGITSCYIHQYLALIESAKQEERIARQGCIDNPNAQVVMPNCFAGSMAVTMSGYDATPFSGRLTYRPSTPAFGRLSKEPCRCHIDGPPDLRI